MSSINPAGQQLVMLADGQMKLITMRPINNADCKLPATTTTMLTPDRKNLLHILPPGTNILQIPGPLQLMPQVAVTATTSQTPTTNATTSSTVETTVTSSNVKYIVNSVSQKPPVKQQTVTLQRQTLSFTGAPNAVTLLKLSNTALARPVSQGNHYRNIYINAEQLEKQRLPDCGDALNGIVSKIDTEDNNGVQQKMEKNVSLLTLSQTGLARPIFQGNHLNGKPHRNLYINTYQIEKNRLLVCEAVLKGIVSKIVFEENKALRQEMQKKVAAERLIRTIANKRFAVLFKHSEKVRKEIIHKKLLMEKDLYIEIQKEICKEVADMEKEAAARSALPKKFQNPVVRIHRIDVAKALAQMDRERRCNAKRPKNENADGPASHSVRKMQCTKMEKQITSQKVQKKTTQSNDNESVLGLPWDVEAKIVGKIGIPIKSEFS